MYNQFMSFLDVLLSGRSYGSSFVEESIQNGSNVFFSFRDTLAGLDSKYVFITTCILLAISLAGCFFGYKLTRLYVTITGFIGGALIGSTIGHSYFASDSSMTILSGVIGGLIVALFAYIIYKIGIFFLGFSLAFITAVSTLPFSNELQFFCAILIGLIVGVLALRFLRPIIIIFTAVGFGSTIPALIIEVCEYMDFTQYNGILENPLAPFIFCILGVIVQFLTTESEAKRKRREAEEEALYDENGYPIEEDENVAEEEAAAPTFSTGKKKDKKKEAKKTKSSDSNSNKKSIISSFMDAVDSGDSEAIYPEEEVADTGEIVIVDSSDVDVVDNSERPVEEADFTQLD